MKHLKIEIMTTTQNQLSMNFERTLGAETPRLVRRFFDFHKANPGIYQKFEHYAFELFGAKPTRTIGAQIIIERLRYDVYVDPNMLDEEFKLPNEFAPGYARLFMERNPRYNGLINVRTSVFDDYFNL